MGQESLVMEKVEPETKAGFKSVEDISGEVNKSFV